MTPAPPPASGSVISRACLPLVEPATAKARSSFAECGADESARVATWGSSARAQLLAIGGCTTSPLVVDLDGTSLAFSSIANGAAFDLFGVGTTVHSAWPVGNVAFLVLDANGDGRIVASELFGNATDGGRWADGWTDRDRDGESTTRELSSLADHGIEVLELGATRIARPSSLDVHGNEIPLLSTYRTASGRTGALADVFFRFRW